MKSRAKQTLFMTLLLLTIWTVAPTIAAATPLQQSGNLLTNPGFEAAYDGEGLANGWQAWADISPEDMFDDCTKGYHKRPRWGQATDFLFEGASAQFVGNNWDTWNAGVKQTVTVTPGSRYRFSFYARGRASMDPSPTPSETYIQMNVQAGVDLTGSSNRGNVSVFGAAGSPHDTWQQFSSEFTATGSEVTLFLMADFGVAGVNQCLQYLSLYFDNAELVELAPPPTNTPLPLPTSPPSTNAPISTETPIPTETPVPTATLVPTDTPTPLPPSGTICVNAFNDENNNAVHDVTEGFLAGVTFTVMGSNGVVGQAVSTGAEAPNCFEALPPGSYEIMQLVPSRLRMTTADTAPIDVVAGNTYGIEFGSRIATEAEIRNTSSSSPGTIASDSEIPVVVEPEVDAAPITAVDGTNDQGSILAYSGLIVLVLAVIILGGFLYLFLRQQA